MRMKTTGFFLFHSTNAGFYHIPTSWCDVCVMQHSLARKYLCYHKMWTAPLIACLIWNLIKLNNEMLNEFTNIRSLITEFWIQHSVKWTEQCEVMRRFIQCCCCHTHSGGGNSTTMDTTTIQFTITEYYGWFLWRKRRQI